MKRFLYEDQNVILKNGASANVILYWDEKFYMVVEPDEDTFDETIQNKETVDICVDMFGPYESLDMVNEMMHHYCMDESWYAFE